MSRVELRGRVALVTGAGTRVGRAIATRLGAEGMRVGVHFANSRAGADAAVADVIAAGGEASAFQADLTNPAHVEPLVAAVERHFGALDLLVNSAASMTRTDFGAITAEAFDAIIALNLRAPLLLAQAAARLLERNAGAIVNIGDHMGSEPWRGYVPHGVAKAAVEALTRHLASAMAPRVRVNCVVPGAVLAPEGWGGAHQEAFAAETPLKRLGSPDDVIEAILYLAQAPYVTGEVVRVDGGRHVR
ncbi:MAG: SDR family oxidoreductase [Gemmatimonadetes bacterium]|nr:SDR family oxidoreductase [Gemmatimonadota bacterium]